MSNVFNKQATMIDSLSDVSSPSAFTLCGLVTALTLPSKQ